jgi:ATP-dependent protease HslVU (ClpYQ) ATPase subunit
MQTWIAENEERKQQKHQHEKFRTRLSSAGLTSEQIEIKMKQQIDEDTFNDYHRNENEEMHISLTVALRQIRSMQRVTHQFIARVTTSHASAVLFDCYLLMETGSSRH